MQQLVSTRASHLRHLLRMAIGQQEIGQRIRQAREAADLTQQQLADRIGIQTAQSISRYERGETEVSTKRLRKIAEATGKELDYFVQLLPGEVGATEPGEAEVSLRLAAVEEQLQELRRELLRRLPDVPDASGGHSSG